MVKALTSNEAQQIVRGSLQDSIDPDGPMPFFKGQPVNGFQGALPQSEIKAV